MTQIIHNDLKPFGATINHATGTLWFGNTVDSTVTAIDAKTGAVKGRLVLDERQRSETVRDPEAENDHYRHRGNGDGSGDRSAG